MSIPAGLTASDEDDSQVVVLYQRERGILRQMIALLLRQAQCSLLHLARSFFPSQKSGGDE